MCITHNTDYITLFGTVLDISFGSFHHSLSINVNTAKCMKAKCNAITTAYRIRRICPSMCHKLLGNGTWYVLLATVLLQRCAAATGSILLRVSRTLLRGTTVPSASKNPLII